jgi:hypothetical protein
MHHALPTVCVVSQPIAFHVPGAICQKTPSPSTYWQVIIETKDKCEEKVAVGFFICTISP